MGKRREAWRERRVHGRRVRQALDLLLDHKEPRAHGFTWDEEDEAIDLFNEKAARLGWGVWRGKAPRTHMPPFPKYLGIPGMASRPESSSPDLE